MSRSKESNQKPLKGARHRAHNLLMIIDFACEMLRPQVSADGQEDLERIRLASEGLKEIVDEELTLSPDEPL